MGWGAESEGKRADPLIVSIIDPTLGFASDHFNFNKYSDPQGLSYSPKIIAASNLRKRAARDFDTLTMANNLRMLGRSMKTLDPLSRKLSLDPWSLKRTSRISSIQANQFTKILQAQFPKVSQARTYSSTAPAPLREEPLEGYQTGGYCPVVLGEVLASRYTVLRKLGWGVSSTVWLAHDAV
jgi:hypothetical protein